MNKKGKIKMLNGENLKNRKKGIGASDMAGILGLSKWSTPVSVFLSKTRDVVDFETGVTRRGHRLEDFVLYCLNKDTRLLISSVPQTIFHPQKEFILCHLDAVALLKDNLGQLEEDKIIEAKTQHLSQRNKWGAKWTDQIPEHIFIQAQYQLLVTGRNEVLIPVLFAKEEIFKSMTIALDIHPLNYKNLYDQYNNLFEFQIYKVKRNEDLIIILFSKAIDFWENHVLKNIAPEARNIEEIKALFPTPSVNKTIEANETDIEALILIRDKEEKIKEIESEIAKLQVPLMNKIQDAEFLISSEGKELIKYSLEDYRSFDKTSLKKKNPAIYEEFEVNKPRRVFRIIRKNIA